MASEFIGSSGLRVSRKRLVADKCSAYYDLIPRLELLPGVEKTLANFKGKYRMAVASSSPYREIMAILAHHGLTDNFEIVVGGDMVERKKPDPEIYLQAAARLGLMPSECVAFEDSESGIAAADSAGLASVAVPHAMSIGHDFSRADAVLKSLEAVDEELFAHLKRNRHWARQL
jgi:beta-phosphoglucomutase